MNRSLRAKESEMQMQAALRQQLRMKEKEEELALFLEMKRREKEHNSLLFNNTEEDFDSPLAGKPGASPIFNISSSNPARKTGVDDFLNSDNDKNDYEWLLTPPGTPLFPSLEMESQQTVMSQIGTPKARPTTLKSRLANPQQDPAIRGNMASKQAASSPGFNSSGSVVRRPSSSGGPGSRPATPTGRPTPTSASRPSRSSTPTSRASLPSPKPATSTIRLTTSAAKSTSSAAKSTSSATRPTSSVTKTTVPARSSTPTRSTVRSSTPTRSTARSSTPTRSTARSSTPTRSTARSSTPTPTARSSIPPSKSTSRAATPTRRPSTPSSASSVSAPSIKSSPSVTKPPTMITRSPVLSHGASPTVKSKPWKPSEMPGYSLNAPPNLRTTLADRPLSATRGRPGAPSSRSSSIEPLSNGRTRRQSCSPSRLSARNGIMHASGSSVPAISRHSKVNDNVSPVLIGTKMVERVINMRKLAPPRQDDKHSPHSNLSGKSASPDSSGFGRTLSKKSLDMAIRHMDIRRSIPGNLRPLMTNIPASSMYSVRSGRTQTRTVSFSDSPHATSSNASSEISVNKNGINLDGIELEDDVGSDRGGRSPIQGR